MEDGLLLREEGGVGGESRRRGEGEWTRGIMIEEVKKLGILAGPMVAVTVSEYLLQVISLMMVGHLGQLSLSSSAMATSLTGVTGFSILITLGVCARARLAVALGKSRPSGGFNLLLLGMASALETLCGQAYGAQQYQALGTQLHRAIFSLILVCLPLSLIWIFMGKILTFIGQDPLISFEAGKYAMWMIPGLFAYATLQALTKFLQSQSLTLPLLLSSFATLCFHIPLCWILVFKSGMGNDGAALAISVSYWLMVIVLGFYVKYSPSCKRTRAPFSKEVFEGINEFYCLAIPSAVMICLEWWSFELLILLSGLLPNPQLETSVLSICLTTIAFLYTIPSGLGAAVSTRVSNELGAEKPAAARMAVCVGVTVTVTGAIIVSTTLFAIRSILGYAYSNEKEVIDYVTEMVPLICFSIIMDGIQGVLSGVARGCGWQHIGAYINLGAFYLLGIPAAVVLAFVLHFGGKGLWIGVYSGATVQTALLSLVTSLTNWRHQAHKAKERVFADRLLEDK